MDTLDTAAVYSIAGGVVAGAANWAVKGAPDVEAKGNLKYYSLFGAMGCLAGTLAAVAVPSTLLSTPVASFMGGLVGSYFLLGLGNYF